jgi:NAD-dependent dihydropyrimidine dehydrogenase PreA subunit
MRIDPEKCVGCGQCVPYCPIKAIDLKDGLAEIDFDRCAECTNCLRLAECPTDAIDQQELVWPRTVRSILSDVLTIAQESGISGRGTEEMKTNEVTGRFKPGFAGIAIELGRPVLGARFYDVEKVAMAVAGLGVEFEKANPTTSLMEDSRTGKFKTDVLNENVLSAILEFCVRQEQLPALFEILKRVAGEIDTVFSLDLACRVNPDWTVPSVAYAEKAGLWVSPNGKTNVGLGRPRAKEEGR